MAVTVYPDRARVTRRAKVDVEPGERRIRLDNLPLGLRADSVRAGGQGPAAVLGVDVARRQHPRTVDDLVAGLEDERRGLLAERSEVADLDAVAAERYGFLTTLAGRAGSTYARAVAGGDVDTAGVASFAASLAEQLTAVAAERRALRERMERLSERIEALDRRIEARHRRGDPDTLAVDVSLDASAAGAVVLDVSYVVDGARWQSAYDVRVDGDRLALTWYGLVTQHTGEDWPECELALSTARPAEALSVEEPDPWYLDRYRPPVPLPARAPAPMAYAMDSMAVGAAPGAAPDATPLMAQAAPIAEIAAVVAQGAAAATYTPARPVAVPADGTAHRATVAVLDLDATLDHLTVPARGPEAYLRATATNTSPHTLLPGRASVFHGGDFVGATDLTMWAPGEELELALGIDDRVRVERKLARRTAGRQLLTATRRREVEYLTTVANHTGRPTTVTVHDQLPVSRDEGITVRETRFDPTPADRTDLGILTWRLPLAPGETGEIAYGFRVDLARGVDLLGWRD